MGLALLGKYKQTHSCLMKIASTFSPTVKLDRLAKMCNTQVLLFYLSARQKLRRKLFPFIYLFDISFRLAEFMCVHRSFHTSY